MQPASVAMATAENWEIPFEREVFQLTSKLRTTLEGNEMTTEIPGTNPIHGIVGQLWDQLCKLDSATSAECEMIDRKLQLLSYEQKLIAMGEKAISDSDDNLDLCETRISHVITSYNQLHDQLSKCSASLASLGQSQGQLPSFNGFLGEFLAKNIPTQLKRIYNLSMFVICQPSDVMKDSKEAKIIVRFLLSAEQADVINLPSFQNSVIKFEQLQDFKNSDTASVPKESPIQINYMHTKSASLDFPEFVNGYKGNFFARIEIKSLERAEKILVTEASSYCFLFLTEINLFGMSHVIWTASAPFILASNIVKYPCPFNNFWMYNFELCPPYLMPGLGIIWKTSPESGLDELHVGWPIFISKLKKKFEQIVSADIGLPDDSSDYFGQKLFGKCYSAKKWSELYVTKKKITDDKFYTESGKPAKFSFWEFFQQDCLLLKPRKVNTNFNFHKEFKAKLIYGFISWKKAEDYINRQREPCFIIRFPESQLQSLDICYKCDGTTFEHVVVSLNDIGRSSKGKGQGGGDCKDFLSQKGLVQMIMSHDRLKRIEYVIGPDHYLNPWRMNWSPEKTQESSNYIRNGYKRLKMHLRVGTRYIRSSSIYKSIKMEVYEISVRDPYLELKAAMEEEEKAARKPALSFQNTPEAAGTSSEAPETQDRGAPAAAPIQHLSPNSSIISENSFLNLDGSSRSSEPSVARLRISDNQSQSSSCAITSISPAFSSRSSNNNSVGNQRINNDMDISNSGLSNQNTPSLNDPAISLNGTENLSNQQLSTATYIGDINQSQPADCFSSVTLANNSSGMKFQVPYFPQSNAHSLCSGGNQTFGEGHQVVPAGNTPVPPYGSPQNGLVYYSPDQTVGDPNRLWVNNSNIDHINGKMPTYNQYSTNFAHADTYNPCGFVEFANHSIPIDPNQEHRGQSIVPGSTESAGCFVRTGNNHAISGSHTFQPVTQNQRNQHLTGSGSEMKYTQNCIPISRAISSGLLRENSEFLTQYSPISADGSDSGISTGLDDSLGTPFDDDVLHEMLCSINDGVDLSHLILTDGLKIDTNNP